jgi:glycerol-3-phosphate dehydrogenase (NAD(P)+)
MKLITGMALARMLTNAGNDVQMWSALPEEIEEYSTTRRHRNLPNMIIPDEMQFTTDLEEACTDKDILLFAVPSVVSFATLNHYTGLYVSSSRMLVAVYGTEGVSRNRPTLNGNAFGWSKNAKTSN